MMLLCLMGKLPEPDLGLQVLAPQESASGPVRDPVTGCGSRKGFGLYTIALVVRMAVYSCCLKKICQDIDQFCESLIDLFEQLYFHSM